MRPKKNNRPYRVSGIASAISLFGTPLPDVMKEMARKALRRMCYLDKVNRLDMSLHVRNTIGEREAHLKYIHRMVRAMRKSMADDIWKANNG